MFKRILVAVNDSEPATWALELAASIASEQRAELHLLHVVNRLHAPPAELDGVSTEFLDDLRSRGIALLNSAVDLVPQSVPHHRVIREGKPADEILAAARELDAELIVMGTHGRSRLAHLLLGSTAEAVVRQAACPVLTVPRKPAAAPLAKSSNGKNAATPALAGARTNLVRAKIAS
jgi:nucleotide-binding universal stress UspA family protein